MLQSKICPVCKKEFFPTMHWVYRDEFSILCSWKCFRINEKSATAYKRKYRDRQVEQLTTDGELVRTFKTSHEAADFMKCPYSSLSQACKENKKFKGYIWRYKDEVSEVSKES